MGFTKEQEENIKKTGRSGYLSGEFFHCGYKHNGCDNELSERCKKISKYVWAENAKVYHDHPIRKDFEGEVDEVHKIARSFYEADRKLLRERSKMLGFELRENFVHPDIKLSVVIPVKNKLEMTEKMIKNLKENTPSLGQVILIDDHSTEDFKQIKDIEYYLNKGKGVCGAWNYGASLAKFPYIAFLNNDIVFTPNWDKPLIEALDNDVWAVSPYHTSGKVPFEGIKHKNMDNQLTGIDFLGSCFIMTKDTWNRIGPIDDRLNIWCGDNYIYESIREDFGRQCKEISESCIHHFVSQTLDRSVIQSLLDEDVRVLHLIYSERNWGNRKKYCYMTPSIDLRLKLPIKDLHKMKVLNVGAGDGNSGLARQLPYLNFKQLDHIDVHQHYLDKAKKLDWTCKNVNFINADIRNFDFSGYDFAMIFDVLEHLKKEESIEIINKIKTKLIVFIPLEKEFRINTFGVEAQDHLSLWTEQDFKDLGFQTEVLNNFHCDDKNRWNALWAVRN